MLDAVSAPDLGGRVTVQSFSVPTMTLARDLAPQLRRELIVESVASTDDLLTSCQELDVAGCNLDGRLLLADPDLLDSLHAAGLSVGVWTLNEPEQWTLAVQAGVDGIITDRPDRLLGWLAARA